MEAAEWTFLSGFFLGLALGAVAGVAFAVSSIVTAYDKSDEVD